MSLINSQTFRHSSVACPKPTPSEPAVDSPFTLAIWLIGGLMIASGMVQFALQVAVPLFGLQNAQWQRPDNPVSVHAAVLQLNVGALWILAAQSPLRRKHLLSGLVVVTWVCFGTRDLGILAW